MSKPREFSIIRYSDETMKASGVLLPKNTAINVIEYSAYEKAIESLRLIESAKFKNGDKMDVMNMRSVACNTLDDLEELEK